MQAQVLTDLEQFEAEERERPTPAADEVLINVRNVGICGSDVHYWQNGRIGDFVVEGDLVLGHESAGEVVDVGDAVSGLEAGDRVATEPGIPCRRCQHCKRGFYNLCRSDEFMATPPRDGAFVEYVSWPADFVYPLPDSVTLTEGALCEPISVCINACRRGDVGVGDTVLVTGCGPIGQISMEVAYAFGATDVIVSDVVPEKLDRTLERGASRAVNVAEEDLEAAVADFTDGQGADVVIEASGAESAMQSTIDAVRVGGTVVFVGMPEDGDIPLDTMSIIAKEADVHGSFRFKNTYPEAISLLEKGAITVADLVDFEMSLADLQEAFERTRSDETVIKGLITI